MYNANPNGSVLQNLTPLVDLLAHGVKQACLAWKVHGSAQVWTIIVGFGQLFFSDLPKAYSASLNWSTTVLSATSVYWGIFITCVRYEVNQPLGNVSLL